MKFKKVLALFLTVAMLLSFSTMFVSANTRSVGYPQSWVNVGETIELSLSSGVLYATWSSSDPSIATVSPSGEVTGVSRGSVTITTVCDYTTGGSETFTTYIDVYDNRGIVNGEEYYIMNVSNSKVLSLASSSTANNTGIVTSSRGTSNTKKWKLTQQSTGKYTFVSMYNYTSKGMYASSDDVYLYTVGSSATHFEIERVNSGTYQGTYRIRYNGKYLAANSSNDVYLTSTLSSKCYWSMSRADKRHADIYSFNYTYVKEGSTKTYNSTTNDSKFCTTFNNLGYTATSNPNDTDWNAYTDLHSNDDIFVYRGHGAPGKLAFETTNNVVYGYIKADDVVPPSSSGYSINNIAGANSLASLRCVLYIGCSTGVDYEKNSKTYNLIDTVFEKGAHFVLGTSQTTYSNNSNEFLSAFLDSISEGKNISDAIDSAIDIVGSRVPQSDGTLGSYPIKYWGDSYQYLN